MSATSSTTKEKHVALENEVVFPAIACGPVWRFFPFRDGLPFEPSSLRLKHRYFAYLREAKRLSETSIDIIAAALHRFEAYTKHREFKAFHYQQAVGFKRHLADQVSRRSGGQLSKATLFTILAALRSFFVWLAGQPAIVLALPTQMRTILTPPKKIAGLQKHVANRGHLRSISYGTRWK